MCLFKSKIEIIKKSIAYTKIFVFIFNLEFF